MKQEFQLLKDIIRDYTPEDYSYEPTEGNRRAKQSDYDQVYVIPVSDPNAATMSQKVVQYQAVMQLAQQAPQLYDLPYLHRQMLDVLGIKNADKLVPTADDEKPRDPVSENMDVLTGKPVKAFIYQDHQAHLDVHMSFMNDPKIRALVGQSPNAGVVQAAIEAHIADHLAFEYRKQIEEQLGVPLPKPNEVLPEDAELEVSRLVARASQQLLAKNEQEVAQQEAAQIAQDPLTQIQQRELQVKEMEAQARSQKMQADIELEKARLELEKMRIDSQERIAGANLGAKAISEDKQLRSKELLEGAKMGVNVVQQDKQLEANKNNSSKE